MSSRKNYDQGTGGNQLRGVLCTLAGAISWGFSGACGQYLFMNYNLDSRWLATVRMLIAGIILTVAYIIRERKNCLDIFQSTKDFFGVIIFAVLGVWLCQYTYLNAIKLTNAGTATVLQYLCPVLVLVYSCLHRLRLPRLREIFAVALAVFGTFLIATHGDVGSLVISKEGLTWGLLAAVGFFFYTVLPENLVKKWGSQPVVGYGMLISGIVFGCVIKVWNYHVHLNFRGILALLMLTLIGTMAAFMLYLQGVRDIGPVRTSMIACVEPVSATLFSVLWLGSGITSMDMVGMGCILVTVIILAVKD